MTLSIAMISDVHHALADENTKMSTRALSVLAEFKQFCDEKEPDLVVDIGDRIEETTHDPDLLRADEYADAFNSITQDKQGCLGNHDVYTLSKAEWETALGIDLDSHSIDLNGHHLVFFNPNVNNSGGASAYTLTTAELDWLEADLAATALPAIVFTHVPLFSGALTNNFYFEGTTGRAEWTNAAAARAILSESSAILAVHGHTHWNKLLVQDGLPYVTIQSATERWTTNPMHSKAFAMLQLDDHHISLNVRGYDPAAYRLPKRAAGRLWL